MFGFWENKFFRNLFLTFFWLMAVLILVFGGIISFQLEKGRQASVQQELLRKVERMTQAVDEKFSTVDMIATQIASSTWIRYAGTQSDILYSRMDTLKKQEISQTIGNENDILKIAKSTAVLFPQKNMAIDRVSFWECERYFNSVGLYPELLDKLMEALKGNYSTQVLYTDEQVKAGYDNFIIVKQLQYDDKPRQVLLIYVDGKLFDKFIRDNVSDTVRFGLSFDGMPVYEWNSKDAETAGEQIFVKEVPSGMYRWNYEFTVDMSYINGSGPAAYSLILGCCGLLLLAFAASYLLARLTHRPISILAERFGMKKSHHVYGLEDIEKSYQELNTEKEGMESLANQYYEIGKDDFLGSLLEGTCEKEKIKEHIKQYHLGFQEDMAYLIILLPFWEEDRQKAFIGALLQLQLDCYKDGFPVAMYHTQGMYYLILPSAQGKEALLRKTEQLCIMVDELLPDMDVELYFGRPHHGFQGIHRAYDEAREKMLGGNNPDKIRYYYPLELEIKIINYMRIGHFEDAEDICRHIREENQRRQLLPGEARKVTGLLFEVFYRFSVDMQFELQRDTCGYAEAEEVQDVDNMWDALLEILEALKRSFNENQNLKSLGYDIVEYVKAHFTSSGLSQQDIADHFRVSRPTVSKVFKETMKVNFIDYLHKLRVEQAKVFFEQENYNVPAVAQLCGYENEITFKRAFVKNEGMTPREYVKTMDGRLRDPSICSMKSRRKAE